MSGARSGEACRVRKAESSEFRQLVLLFAFWFALVAPLTCQNGQASALDASATAALALDPDGGPGTSALRSEFCGVASAAGVAEVLNESRVDGMEPTSYADDVGSLLCLLNHDGDEPSSHGHRNAGAPPVYTDVPSGGDFPAPAVSGDVALAPPPGHFHFSPRVLPPPPRPN